MAASDELLIKLVEALAAEGCETADFEIDNCEKIGRMRAARDRAIRDREAAQLLPLGWRVVAERFDVSKATVYNMNQRAQSKRRQHA